MFLKEKGYLAQDFYNEYLELKTQITGLTGRIEIFKRINNRKEMIEHQLVLEQKVQRFRFVLDQLKLNGVKLEDLLLLSIGVNIDTE